MNVTVIYYFFYRFLVLFICKYHQDLYRQPKTLHDLQATRGLLILDLPFFEASIGFVTMTTGAGSFIVNYVDYFPITPCPEVVYSSNTMLNSIFPTSLCFFSSL